MKAPSRAYVEACCGETMNLLLRRLQDEMGVTTGDAAGQFFSGENDSRWLKIANDWTTLMMDYIEHEKLGAEDA